MAVHNVFRRFQLGAIALVVLCGLPPGLGAQAPSAVSRVITAHLDEALGHLEFRTVERREVRGASKVETRQTGQGALEGSFTLDSRPATSRLRIEFGASSYDGETFEFDGAKAVVGFSVPQTGRRSALGQFIAKHDVMLYEGLLGGVLNARWPLLDVSGRQAKIETDGLKNFDGRSHYRLRYRAKRRQGDLNISLYFDSRTFRHMATVYSWSRAQNLGMTITSSSQESDVYLQLEERFADFEAVGRVTLPTTWSLTYYESANRSTSWKYTFKVSQIQ